MNSPIVDVKTILTQGDSSSGFVYEFAEVLFLSVEPDSPDTCITLIDTGGFDPDVNSSYQRPTFQIRVRDKANQYERAYSTMRSILNILHGNRFTVGSTIYVFIQQGDIFDLGRDAKNRVILTSNMVIHRTE